MQPYALFFTRNHAFRTQNLAVFITISQIIQNLLQIFFLHHADILQAPACKYIICMMVSFVIVVVVMAATATLIIMVVMMMLMVMIVTATVIIMVMMMVLMIVIMTATIAVIVMIMMVMMLIHMLSCLFHQLLCHIVFLLDHLKKLCAGQLAAWSGHDGCLCIVLAKHLNRALYLLRIRYIGTA